MTDSGSRLQILRCTKCLKDRDISRFHRDARYKGGYRHQCKDCLAAYQRTYPRTREQTRKWTIRYRYGLSPDEVSALEAAAGGLCGICSRRRPLVIDHDHDTGRVRGLLCRSCNAALSLFDAVPDAPDRIRNWLLTT